MLGSGPIAASRWLVCFGIPTRATPVGQPLIGHPGRVTAVAVGIGSGGRALSASAGSDGTVRVWDPDTGDPVGQRLTGHDVVGGATHADGGPPARGQPWAPAPGDIGPQGVPHVGRNFINGLGGLPGRPRPRAVASRPMPSGYSLDRAR